MGCEEETDIDETRTTGFPFRDKAGEAWLAEQGAEGWRLERIERGRLRFRRTAEPRALPYG